MTYVHFEPEDMQKNALPAALGCIIFPVPLIACPHSRFGRFCANQGLLLLIVFVALKIVFSLLNGLLGWIPLLGPLVALIGWLAMAAVGAGSLWLAWQAFKQQPVRIPYIGDFSIIR